MWELFKYFRLTETVRKKEGSGFYYSVKPYDIWHDDKVLNCEEVPDDTIHLFWSTEEINNFNTFKISRIPIDAILTSAKAQLKEERKGIGEEIENILERVKLSKISELQGLPFELTLKTTAKYVIT